MTRELVSPISDREIKRERQEIIERGNLVEPSEEELRNGWTAKSLTKYLSERLAAQAEMVDIHSITRQRSRRPQEANHRYRPHRWRE